MKSNLTNVTEKLKAEKRNAEKERKIADLKLRKRLKEVVSKLKIKAGMGVIIRTAGESMGLKEIKRDWLRKKIVPRKLVKKKTNS